MEKTDSFSVEVTVLIDSGPSVTKTKAKVGKKLKLKSLTLIHNATRLVILSLMPWHKEVVKF